MTELSYVPSNMPSDFLPPTLVGFIVISPTTAPSVATTTRFPTSTFGAFVTTVKGL